MHITSLPSAGGIGDLGPAAFEFADFLEASGMRVWQMLPICPTGYGESPYQSPSAFAGSPWLISPEKLREQGLLDFTDDELYIPAKSDQVDFPEVQKNREMLLRRAFAKSGKKLSGAIDEFRRRCSWADDYALFAAVKEHFGGAMWTKWPDEAIRFRKPEAVEQYRNKLKDEVNYQLFCQYIFREQWAALKEYCNHRSILLFGDMPIYVAEDSADTWTHPEVFQLDENRLPLRVAGVGPDAFSDDGQLWGNPLYHWKRLRRMKYSWWVDRMRCMTELFDIVRVDHFIGFGHYYSIPYGAPNARKGKWISGPGKHLFRQLRKQIPGMRIVAEDLGEVNAQVRSLMKFTGYPGMRILCYGFDGDPVENVHFPSPAHYTSNFAAYTGTHDNDTVLGWAESASPKALKNAMKTLKFSRKEEAPEAFIRAIFSSACNTAVAPMQDILGLGSEARMNYPGTIGGNWGWRMEPKALTPELAARLKKLNLETRRIKP